jgi:hypothetical protein
VWDMQGRVVDAGKLGSNPSVLRLDGRGWVAGVYAVEVVAGSGRFMERIVKQ